MKRKFAFGLLLALSLTMLPVTNALASGGKLSHQPEVKAVQVVVDQAKEKQLNRILQSVGFPDDELANMQLDQKQYLVDQGVVKYLGTDKKEFYYNGTGVLVEKDSEGVSIQGTIPSTDLSLSITTSQLATKSDGKKRFTITQNWSWYSSVGDTYYNLVDKIRLSHSSDFDSDPYTNGGYQCSHSGQSTSNGINYWLDDCGGRTSEIAYGGAGWNVDIRDGYRDYGRSAMNVIAKKANTNWDNNTSFHSKYAHDTSIGGTIGLTIGPLVLSFGSSSSFDEAMVQKAIWY